MIIEVKVPILAESIAEANLLQWCKKVGDHVKRGENLIDIETDKVTLEVAAPDDGVLTEVLRQDGEDVKSDEVIAKIDTEKKSTVTEPVKTSKEEKPKANTPQQQTLLNPKPVAKPEPKPEIKPTAKSTEKIISDPIKDTPKLSPVVRNLLSKNKLQITDIKTRKHPDRIAKEDILNHLESTLSNDAQVKPAASIADSKTKARKEVAPKNIEIERQEQKTAQPITSVDIEQRPQKRIPMTRLRKRAAERLLAAQHESALLTTFNEVNMQPVIDLRNRYKDEFKEAHDIKLGFMSFFTRATVAALKKFPIINACIEGEDIIYHEYFDIGIAVSSKRGLVVPVLRDADTLSFAGIEFGISEFGQKANDGKLAIEDLTGGTFTITNGGIFGSLLSTPIINSPQSAILGMHKINERPIAENKEVVIRPMMYLALSYDHRIIDGSQAVQFLVSIKEQIEDPSRLLLQI